MPFEKGNSVGAATQFKRGQPSANPGGRPKGSLTMEQAGLRVVLAHAHRFLESPKAIKDWDKWLSETWAKNPDKVLRTLQPFIPRLEVSTSTDPLTGLSRERKRVILSSAYAALQDEPEAVQDVLDVEPEPTP